MTASARTPPGVVFWFRSDLRLHDQPALLQAAGLARELGGWLLPVFVHDARLQAPTRWGFRRMGTQRGAWRAMALQALTQGLQALGSTLVQIEGDPVDLLGELLARLNQPLLVCEDIPAPEEEAQVRALRARGLRVQTVWQSTLLAPEALPFAPQAVPDHFTAFRQRLETHGVRAAPPLAAISALPDLPPDAALRACAEALPRISEAPSQQAPHVDARAAFPWDRPEYHGGERAALRHLAGYCERQLPHRYKVTRNGLVGTDFSSKWSPWLATGALSARTAWAAIEAFERAHGASDSSYWLFFELLWRDHFRWLHRKHGVRLYHAQGLGTLPTPSHDAQAFARWCRGETGETFIDAGMRELAASGYLSNRMRQNVASFLIHELGGDWRAGAAWFEACLIDYDVCSNQCNWLYLSGRGTDPRGQRRFNPHLQAQQYDPDGAYRRLWASA